MATIEERLGKDGSVTYRAKIRLRGLRTPITQTFKRRTEAKQWAAEVEQEVRNGRYLKTIEAKRHTVAETIDRYLRDILPGKSTSMQVQQKQLEEWRAEIGHLTLDEVTPQLITECRDKFKAVQTHRNMARSAATVNRMLAAFSHMLTIAVNEWAWMDDSPIRKVRRLKESRGRVRSLTPNEREKLLKFCDESNCKELGLIVRIALATGMRKSEIRFLCWSDVDLKTGRTVLHHTKNGHRRATYITEPVLSILKEHSSHRSKAQPLIFPSPFEPDRPLNFEQSWRTVLRKSELENFHFHDLRHEFATRLAEQGASLAQLSEALGHQDLSMVKRYAHLNESSILEVVQAMNARTRL